MSGGAGTPPADEGKVAAALAEQPWRETGSLSLRRLGLRTLPAVLARATGLRSLDVSGNRLAGLPPWLPGLSSLEQLIIANNRLVWLDDLLSLLPALRQLDVSGNRLTALPGDVARCDRLRRLDVSGNALEDISVLATAPSLVMLDAACNRIAALPFPPSPATLQSLDLSANRLEVLPASFGALRALRSLDLSGNRLSSAALPLLQELPVQELYLDDNLLTQRVDTEKMPSLRRLSMLGNPVREWPGASQRLPDLAERATASVTVTSDAQPGRRYLDAPTYRADMSMAVSRAADAQRVVDLYYKRFAGMPVAMTFGDSATISLQSLNRSTALAFVDDHQAAGTESVLSLPSSKDPESVRRGTEFLAQAIARVDSAALVADRGTRSPVEFSQPPLARVARVLNLALCDAEQRTLPAVQSLAPLADYLLRVHIGPVVEDSVVINPVPVREADLRGTDAGFWFDVVVTSADVEIAAAPGVRRVFLPSGGASWTCDCPGPEHSCTPQARQPYLYVPIRTGTARGEVTVRCTICNNNNAIQSARVTFTVAPDDQQRPVSAVIDFALTDDAARVDHLRPRQLSVLADRPADGTHTIVVSNGQRAVGVNITESSASEILASMRGKLREIMLGGDGMTEQYDQENRKQSTAFLRDLRQLALLGSTLWMKVVPERADRAYLREQLAARATIQIARMTDVDFPWALIYDIPHELDAEWVPCALLAGWADNRAQLAGYPESCPYQAEHRANVLCPFGFWGYRHLLEQPPSARHGALRTQIRLARPARAAAGRSLALNASLTASHFRELEECFTGDVKLLTCDSRKALREVFADPALPLVYLYCHGRRAELSGTQLAVPFLEIGAGDRIGPTDFAAWDEADNWGPAHWAQTSPLIFINGCETAKLAPEDIVTFVDALAGMDAAGVIGTEIPVTQRIAGEVALRFYRQFLSPAGTTVGIALHRMRIDLLAKGNVAGLVYTAYCSMDLALLRTGAA